MVDLATARATLAVVQVFDRLVQVPLVEMLLSLEDKEEVKGVQEAAKWGSAQAVQTRRAAGEMALAAAKPAVEMAEVELVAAEVAAEGSVAAPAE